MSPLEVTQQVRRIKNEWRRGLITTEQFQAKMDNLRQIVAERNEICMM